MNLDSHFICPTHKLKTIIKSQQEAFFMATGQVSFEHYARTLGFSILASQISPEAKKKYQALWDELLLDWL